MRLLTSKAAWGRWVLAMNVAEAPPPKEYPCFGIAEEEEKPYYLYRGDIEYMAKQIAKVRSKK